MSEVSPLKRYAVPIIIVLIVGGLSALTAANHDSEATSTTECPGHWHAMLRVSIDGNRVPLFNPGTTDDRAGPAVGFHLHDDTGVLHYHPAAERCIETQQMLAKLGFTITDDALILDQRHGSLEGEYETTNSTLSLYTKTYFGAWKEVEYSSFASRQLANGESLLIAYGDFDAQTEQAAVGDVPDQYTPPSVDFPTGRIITFVVLGLLGLYFWFQVDQKRYGKY